MMYTYESFETFEVFTLLRPVFITFFIVTLNIFIGMKLPKSKRNIINGFSVSSISILSIVVSAQILFYNGIIVDEINLAEDSVSSVLFLAIVGLSLLNPLIYFVRHRD